MAAYTIQKHFKGLRADTGRRKGRDPFATGFEDDSDDEQTWNRTKTTKTPPVTKPSQPALPRTSIASPFAAIDHLNDSDDNFLDLPQGKVSNRLPSPASAKTHQTRVNNGAGRRNSLGRAPREAVALAAGPLAYLDDSSEDDYLPQSRRDRRPSPAPRKRSTSPTSRNRSDTPRGDRRSPKSQAQLPPKHTVASPFAGTKYLQDSDSEEDEKASAQRQSSTDSEVAVGTPDESGNISKQHLEVQPANKRKSNGSGVSWRAFSAGRSEQRIAEIEALQASLRQRGRLVTFNTHAVTDDGARVLLSPTYERTNLGARGRAQLRTKSPLRRAADRKTSNDEAYDRGSDRGSPDGGQIPESEAGRPGSAHGSIPNICVEDIAPT